MEAMPKEYSRNQLSEAFDLAVTAATGVISKNFVPFPLAGNPEEERAEKINAARAWYNAEAKPALISKDREMTSFAFVDSTLRTLWYGVMAEDDVQFITGTEANTVFVQTLENYLQKLDL
jgi:hypothetical protein